MLKIFTNGISQQTPPPIDKNHNFILRVQQRCDKMKKVQRNWSVGEVA